MQNRSAYGKMVNHFFHRILELNPGMGVREALQNAITRAALDGYRPRGKYQVVQADSLGGVELIPVPETIEDSKLLDDDENGCSDPSGLKSRPVEECVKALMDDYKSFHKGD